MNPIQSLPELLSMFRRRLGLIVAITFLGCVISVWFALNQPRYYQATAIIQIETPQIAGDISGTTGGTDAGRRLQLIQQRLMARDNLVKVIEKYALFADMPALTMSDKVRMLRIATRLEQITNTAQSWQPGIVPSGLRVTVRLGDSQQAADVANEFARNVLDQNRSRRVELARDTLEFFSEEEAQVSASIRTLETVIADFKRENGDALPANLMQLRTQLANLEETLLEIDRQIIALQTGSERTRRSVLENQITLLEDQKVLVERRMDAIRTSLAAAPMVERRLAALERELMQLQDRYSIITRRRAEAEMGEVLESRQQSERFEILETALEPEHPISPSRKKVAMLGGVISLLAGIAAAFVLEVMNPAIRNAAQLERALDISPVVSIPPIPTRGEKRRRLLAWLAVLVMAAASIPVVLKWATERIGPLRALGGN